MATYTVAAGEIGAHAKTLTANAVDLVVFGYDLKWVEVVSNGAAALYFTVDGSAPAVGGATTYYMPAVASVREVPSVRGGNTTVRLISAGTPVYSVARADR